MLRRDFIRGLAGSAAWPLAARAQQTGKIAKVGYLGPSSLALERVQVDAFKQRLNDLGHVEGKNIAYVFRWAEGNDARYPAAAVELAGLKPDVIVTTGTPGTLAAKRATSTIPIVFASSANPVSAGLVASYSRPGGNVTGFTILGPELEGKRVQLLKEAVPSLSRIAVMWNPANPGIVDFLLQMRAAAAALNITVKPIAEVTQADELKKAFTAIADSQPQAMLVIADRFLLAHRKDIVGFAASQRLPTMYPYRVTWTPAASWLTHQLMSNNFASQPAPSAKFCGGRRRPTFRLKNRHGMSLSSTSGLQRRLALNCRRFYNSAPMSWLISKWLRSGGRTVSRPFTYSATYPLAVRVRFQSRSFSATIFSASKTTSEVVNANCASYAIASNGLCRYPKRSQLSAYERRKSSAPRIRH